MRIARAAGLALALAVLSQNDMPVASATARIRYDARLLAALRADPALAPCRCVQAASWVDETYPRVTVNPQRWRRLTAAQRTRFGARALHDVQAVYLEEWGTPHFYHQVFIVDPSGRQLFAYVP